VNIKGWPCWAKIGIVVGLAVFVLNWPSTSSEWAAWVQAFGSIGAIVGAVWLSDKERRSYSANLEREEKELDDRVKFEVANLAYDVTHFLVRTSSTDHSKSPRYLVDEAEFNELLGRMSWVRRSAKKYIDLEDVRQLRGNLVEVTAILRANSKWDRSIPEDELRDMERWQRECAEISNRRQVERDRFDEAIK